ncbi:MAG: DNA topoisomerase I, partial [Candidatus Aenigmarchaeota archaeon]|nr:DNA topoisomerase I [Candidatus Aenigmarchaeota archaeon]
MNKVFLICEKPNAAKKIANALAENKVKEVESEYGAKYYVFKRNGIEHLAVPAVGHIFTLKDVSKKGWVYPVLDTDWAPTFEVNKSAEFARKYFKTFESLVKDNYEYVIATDLDEEGSVIGYNILRFICKKRDAKRMCFSTLTKLDLIKAYENVLKHIDKGRIESGLTRHELDFLYGINTSRALTLSIKAGGKKLSHYILSAGRVQTPMLYFLIKREKEIKKFKPKPFWQIEAKVKTKPQITCLHKKGKFWSKDEVDKIIKNCKNKNAIVKKITSRKRQQLPPYPFDLTSLQTEAYKFFGYSPKRTISIAQNLYTAGYISYPRTSSQKLPKQLGYKNILKALQKLKGYKELSAKLLSKTNLVPREGPKSD